MIKKLIMNMFAKRQTEESKFSHYSGTVEELIALVVAHMSDAKPGYTDGVLEVPVPADGFYSAVCSLRPDDKITGVYESRRKDEDPRLSLGVVNGEKSPAKSVSVILYSSILLVADGDNNLPAEEGNYEIISINASETEGAEPINPETLMHNHFGSDGGTTTGLSDAEFTAKLKESFTYWKTRMMKA